MNNWLVHPTVWECWRDGLLAGLAASVVLYCFPMGSEEPEQPVEPPRRPVAPGEAIRNTGIILVGGVFLFYLAPKLVMMLTGVK